MIFLIAGSHPKCWLTPQMLALLQFLKEPVLNLSVLCFKKIHLHWYGQTNSFLIL